MRVLEASDGVGGRGRTDLVEGFHLDRGFQVLLTAYPETRCRSWILFVCSTDSSTVSSKQRVHAGVRPLQAGIEQQDKSTAAGPTPGA